MTPPLPDWLHVVVRGWLNCNQVLLRGRAENCLVDSGHVSHADATLALLRQPQVLGGGTLHRLVNTHCHSDHVGGNATLVRAYGCSVAVPLAAARHVADWDRAAMWLAYADQRSEPFAFDATIAPGASVAMGEAHWQALAAPGHDAAALIYFEPERRILISGDALWESGMGVVLAAEGDTAPYDAAAETLDSIEALAPLWVIPGHGAPFADAPGALRRARERLASLRADPRRAARHAMKVMLVFALLEAGSMAIDAVPAYVDRVPIFRDLNRRCFRLPPHELAALLVGELERAGALERRGSGLFPLISA